MLLLFLVFIVKRNVHSLLAARDDVSKIALIYINHFYGTEN